MATTTATTNGTAAPTTPAPAKRSGFGSLPCIRCGQDATISLDLDDCTTFRCAECDDSFDADDVRDHMARWQRVLAWVDARPGAAE
jgi:hypothetical protein